MTASEFIRRLLDEVRFERESRKMAAALELASLETCLALMALWGRDRKADPQVEIFKDFGSGNNAAEAVTASGAS
jgi:hypothetical protein